MPETLECITFGDPNTRKYTSEPYIAAYEFTSNSSIFVSENVDGCRIFLAVCSRRPQLAPAS